MLRILTNCALALTLTVAMASCSDADKDAAANNGGKAGGPGAGGGRPQTVTALTVQPQSWADGLSALGTVQALESVTIAAKVSETVSRVHFASGQFVGRGTPLVTLTGQQQDASLAQAQAQLREAQSLYNRYAALAKDRYISAAQLDTQRAALETAQAQVATIRANLSDRVIRAPFAGVLGIRRISPGALITPGTEIATLDSIGSVYIDFPVPELKLPSVRQGQAVTATSQAYPDRPFEGTVRNVDIRVDPASRAATVRAAFANPGYALRPGMLMTVRLAQHPRQALVVPEIAIVQNGADSSVFRIGNGDKVSSVVVQLGERRDGWVEIRSGLLAGDRIVVDGSGKVTDGGEVKASPYRGAPGVAPAAAASGVVPAAVSAQGTR
ncbi:efflux RND transporter periplasmic adaptor subunit [Aquilutibacter rugosus]|uniref:efflux RND transporter periplasmic adaptor subunit n=1 Tax=Aquilutibacter rugosus TaxID=3115820 RepID=UPI002F3FC17C